MAPRKRTNARPKAAKKVAASTKHSQAPTTELQQASSVVLDSQQPENPLSQSYNSQFYAQEIALPNESAPLPSTLDLETPLEPQEFALLMDAGTQPALTGPIVPVKEDEPSLDKSAHVFADEQPKTPVLARALQSEHNSSSNSLSSSSASNSLVAGPVLGLQPVAQEPQPTVYTAPTESDLLVAIRFGVCKAFGLKRRGIDLGASPAKRQQIAAV